MRRLLAFVAAIVSGHIAGDPVAVVNDNRSPAGTSVGDTLVLRLTVTPAAWYILGEANQTFRVLAFAEEGKAPTIPAPLVRVRAGTPIRVVIRNPLDDTLTVRGLGSQGSRDSLVVPPGDTRETRFIAERVGTFQYWGSTADAQRQVPARARSPVGLVRPRFDSQLAGAFIIDAPGRVIDDRVFVITEISGNPVPPVAASDARRDRHGVPGREFTALNGRSWPYTERLRYSLGDSVRWRIINTTFQAHPMHLHGFYFRVDSHGSARTGVDSIYTNDQRRMAVTEVIGIGETASIVWSPDRPGGWIFHCHLTNHAAKLPSIADSNDVDYPERHGHGNPDRHVTDGMNGLVVGTTVSGDSRPASWRPARRLRLFVQSDSVPNDTVRRFGYVLQRGAEPKADSVESPGPVLLLTRGEPTSIEVVNRTPEPTAVHWHGIELESYYDGAVGWSGRPGKTAPAIPPGGRFDVHITPKRAGTFMYHTHFDEMRQQFGGLVGALIVQEPGTQWDPARDFVFVISDGRRGAVVINGDATTVPKELIAGTTYRLRFADIAIFRQNLRVQVRRDSSLAQWRAVAKDGFTLPDQQAVVRRASAQVASGETADFELTPDRPGDYLLEIGVPILPAGFQVQGAVRLHVSDK